MMKRLFVVIFAAVCAGCSSARVSVKQGFDFKRVKSVAVLDFRDARDIPESGMIVSDMISQYMVESGLTVVERNQLEQVLDEQKFAMTGAVSQSSAKKIGMILGVDAVVVGSLTGRLKRERTRVVTPGRRRKKIVRGRRGRRRVRRGPREPGQVSVYETETISLGVSAKMVMVETGEVVWIGSNRAEKGGFQNAAEAAIRPIMKKVSKNIRDSF